MPFLVLVFIGSLNSLQFLGLEWLCSPFLFSRFISISKCWTLIFPITRPYVNRRICCNNRILGINWNKVKVRCLFANDTQFSLVVCSFVFKFLSQLFAVFLIFSPAVWNLNIQTSYAPLATVIQILF